MDTENEIDLGFILLKFLVLTKKYLLVILFPILVCTGIGLGHFYTKAPIYQSSALISTGIVKSSISIGLVEELQGLIDDQNLALLSKKLNLGKSAAKLKSVEVESVEEKIDNGKVDVIKVIVKITETEILLPLQKNIVNYLEGTPFAKKKIKMEKYRLNEEIAFLSKELEEVSILKSNISKISEKGNTTNTSFNLEDIYRQSMELFEKRLQLIHDLETIENFQVIQGFTAYQKPVSPKLSLSLVGGFAAGLILAFLFIFIKEVGKHLKTLEERSK